MPGLQVIMDGDGCWPDLRERGFERAEISGVALLENGTVGGNPTITVRCELADGKVVLAETTYALFANAARAFEARREAIQRGEL
jgi:hypothetical protein